METENTASSSTCSVFSERVGGASFEGEAASAAVASLLLFAETMSVFFVSPAVACFPDGTLAAFSICVFVTWLLSVVLSAFAGELF